MRDFSTFVVPFNQSIENLFYNLMMYNTIRPGLRLVVFGVCIAFQSFQSTAQVDKARFELKRKPIGLLADAPRSRNPKVHTSKQEIHVKSREYFARKMSKNLGSPGKRPSKSIYNVAAAGDTLFFEDFQSGTWPASMPRVNRDGRTVDANISALGFGTDAWIASEANAGTDNIAALSTSWYAPVGQADDWMITPAITLTPNNLLRWKARAVDPLFPDGYEVRICTNCPANFTANNVLTSFSTVLYSIDAEEVGDATIFEYQERQIDLSTYAGQTVRLAFRNNSTDQFLLSIDDIFVGKQLAVDAELTDLTAMFSNLCTLGANESVKVKVTNKGSLAISSAAVTIKVNNVQAGLVSVSDLSPNETDSVLVSGLDLSSVGAYDIEATVSVADDGNPANNSLAASTQKVAPTSLSSGYLQSFEDGANLDNWVILDNNNDGASWINFQTPGAGAEGTTGYMGYADLATIPADGDDWIVTSCFTAEAGVTYQYSFYHRATGTIDHSISLVAGTDQNPAALNKTIFNRTGFPTDNLWYQVSDTFSVATTGLYYFGIHATSPAGNGRFRLDELKFRVAPPQDASIKEILFPNASSYLCGSGTQQFVYAIKNDGAQILTNIPVTLSISGAGSQTINMVVPSLAPGETDTLIFNGTVNISTPGDYVASIYSTVTGDGDITSDTAQFSFTIEDAVAYPLENDFEALAGQFDLPVGWWSDQYGSLAEHGVDASLGVAANLFANDPTFGSVLEANLISPKIENVAADGYLTFKYRLVEFASYPDNEYTMDPGDSIIIWASKNCGAFQRLKHITSDDHTPSLEFAKIIVSLTPLNISTGDVISIRIQLLHNGNVGDFYMDIDEYGVKTVTPYDLKVANGKLPILSMVKLKQADPVSLGGTVANEGTQDFAQWRLVARVTPGSYADSAGLNSLASGVTQAVNMATPFVPTQTGFYTIKYTAKAVSPTQVEADLSNNELTGEYEVTDSTMGRDVGDSEPGGIGYGSAFEGRRIMGQVYRLKVADTLTSITFWADDLQEPVSVKGYYCRANGSGNPTPITGQDSTVSVVDIDPSESFNWFTVSFKKPNLPKGRPLAGNARYYFGLINTAGDLRLGFNSTNYEANTSYVLLNGAFNATDNLTIGGINLFVRPNFGQLTTTDTRSQIEMSLANAELYPNPGNGISKLAINLNHGSPVSVDVHNLAGQVISSQSFDTNRGRNVLDLPTADLARGVYFVKITTQGFASTKKLVIE